MQASSVVSRASRGAVEAQPRLAPVSLPRARRFASSSDGFRCQSCGQRFAKWQGQCSSCSQWGSVVSAKPAEPQFRQSNAASFSQGKTKRAVAWSRTGNDVFEEDAPHALRMNEVELDTFVERIELPERELVGRRAVDYSTAQ